MDDIASTAGMQDGPHARELLDANTRLSGDPDARFTAGMLELLTRMLATDCDTGAIDLGPEHPADIAELILALTRGLEADRLDPNRARRRLSRGIELLVNGLAST